MIRFVLLAAVITTASAQQAWIEQLREADRLRNENRYDEAERAYIVARKQAETLGADELPMAITLNRIGYQHQILGRLREAERSYAAALAIAERKSGATSHHAVKLALDLSSAYLELGQVSRAESLIRRFLRKDNELSSNDRATLLLDLASALAAKRKFADAEALSNTIRAGNRASEQSSSSAICQQSTCRWTALPRDVRILTGRLRCSELCPICSPL